MNLDKMTDKEIIEVVEYEMNILKSGYAYDIMDDLLGAMGFGGHEGVPWELLVGDCFRALVLDEGVSLTEASMVYQAMLKIAKESDL